MNTISIYSSLPYWLQNIAVSLHGYKLKKQRFNDDFYKILDFLNSTHGWSKEQIRSYKEEHTFKILEQAYNHCPYYRKKYTDVGLSPSDFKQLGDLQKFPILTKEEIRENWLGLVADNIPRKELIRFNTSGSTGKALDFYWTKYSAAYYWAVDQRYKNRFGFTLGKACVNFSGRPIVPISTSKPPYWRYDRVLNRYFINMHQLNEVKIRDIVNWINSKCIEMFIGYPSIMAAFANELTNAEMALDFPPKHIFTGAEKLYENQKNILQAVFKGVQIHELYSFLSKPLSLPIVSTRFITRISRLVIWNWIKLFLQRVGCRVRFWLPGSLILVCLLFVIKMGIRQCSPTGNVDVDYIAKL